MSKFQPGDLCVIVDHPHWVDGTNRDTIGCHVILTALAENDDPYDLWQPRWYVTGAPKTHSCPRVSEKILRKIEPPPLDEEETNEEELLV